MSYLTSHSFDGDNRYLLDFTLPADIYKTHRDKTIDTVLANVEVKGFRKGKAPRELSLKQVDPGLLATTLLQETVNQFSQPGINEALEVLGAAERSILSIDLDTEPENTKEYEDGTFKFRLVMKLVPKIDLTAIETINIQPPTTKDITDLPSKEEFRQNEIDKLLREQNQFVPTDEQAGKGYEMTVEMSGEIDGKPYPSLEAKGMKVILGAGMFLPVFETELLELKKGDTKTFDLPFPADYVKDLANKTAKVTIVVNEVSKPQFEKIEDLIGAGGNVAEFYSSMDDLEKDITSVYEKRVQNLMDSVFRKRVVEKLLQTIPDFEIDDQTMHSEAHRIIHSMEHEAEGKGVTVAEVLADSGLSAKDPKIVRGLSDKAVSDEVHEYVTKELKLANILSLIYEVKLLEKDKPSKKDFDDSVADALANKSKYNLPPDATAEQVRNIMTDRIIRQYAGNWIVEKARGNLEK